MIVVSSVRDRFAGYWTIYMEGHAEHADKGKDVVCAAVSALSLAAHAWAVDRPEKLEQKRSESGFSYLKMSVTQETSAAFDLILCGLCSIAKDYPDCVHVTVEDL